MDKKLEIIFDELEKEAYNMEYHSYDYKITNQIVRANFERLLTQIKDITFTNGTLERKCAELRDQNEQLNQVILKQRTELDIKDDALNACDVAIRALSESLKNKEVVK